MYSVSQDLKIGVIGLGYVGLPLALEFSNFYQVVGFDVNPERVKQLRCGVDKTGEVNEDSLCGSTVNFSDDHKETRECQIYIVTVPTPINPDTTPDLVPLRRACEIVGKYLSQGNIVVFESTVYPGATDEICIPILEAFSDLKINKDFYVGYSPERVNPGDKNRKFSDIVKITSGSNEDAASFIDMFYKRVLKNGTCKVGSIKVAEAAKVLENTQRDVNIALINEFSRICHTLNISTHEVLDAARTKWNFFDFRPGLVGGHCIGIDPFYLTYKSSISGYTPKLILSGREINDGVAAFVSTEFIKSLVRKRIHLPDATVLVCGLTFKENCPDFRNSKSFEIIEILQSSNLNVEVHDPYLSSDSVNLIPKDTCLSDLKSKKYSGVIFCVAHDQYSDLDVMTLVSNPGVIFDLKKQFKKVNSDFCL